MSSCSYLDPAATVTPTDWMCDGTSFVATTIRFGSVVIRVSDCENRETRSGSASEQTATQSVLTSEVDAGVTKALVERGRSERRADWVVPAPSRANDRGVARGIIPKNGPRVNDRVLGMYHDRLFTYKREGRTGKEGKLVGEGVRSPRLETRRLSSPLPNRSLTTTRKQNTDRAHTGYHVPDLFLKDRLNHHSCPSPLELLPTSVESAKR